MGEELRRVLIVAYYFPPIGGIGAIRMARFAQELPRFGWDPTVIAPRDTPHPQDPRLTVREEHVARTRSFELSRLGRAIPDTAPASADAATPAGGMRSRMRPLAHRYLFYPDAQVGWYPDAVRTGTRLLARTGYDAILASSFPLTSQLIARRLHRRSGIPWVAEFRDPWSHRLGRGHPYRRHAESLERRIALEADRVIVPTPTMATHLSRRWDRKVDLIMNGHDLEIGVPTPPQRPTITHVGTYYPERQDLRALWDAIRGLGEPTSIRFVGSLPPELAAELDAYGLTDRVEVTGFVPHDEAMGAMEASSVLIASGFSGGDDLSRAVIPAKIFEYLASGLPIIYVGDPQDDTWQLLESEPGCHLLRPGDVPAARAALRTALAATPITRDVARHSRRERAAQLAAILDEVSGAAR